MVYKYEFVSDYNREEFEEKCRKLGEENWEMITAFCSGANLNNYVAIFKKYIAP